MTGDETLEMVRGAVMDWALWRGEGRKWEEGPDAGKFLPPDWSQYDLPEQTIWHREVYAGEEGGSARYMLDALDGCILLKPDESEGVREFLGLGDFGGKQAWYEECLALLTPQPKEETTVTRSGSGDSS